jgi:Melibiase
MLDDKAASYLTRRSFVRKVGAVGVSVAAELSMPTGLMAQTSDSPVDPQKRAADTFWSVGLSKDRRSLELLYRGRVWLSGLRIGLRVNGIYEWSDASTLKIIQLANTKPTEILVTVQGYQQGEILLHIQKSKVRISIQKPRRTELERVEIEAIVEGGTDPIQCRLEEDVFGREATDIQQMVSGRAVSRLNRCVFDRFRDEALRVSARDTKFTPTATKFQVTAGTRGTAAPICSFEILEQVFGSRLQFYSSLNKERWPEAPVGWCSFHYYGNVLNEDDIVRNAEALARDYKAFGLKYILIDGGWQANGISGSWTTTNDSFSHGMKWVAGKIRGVGLKPAIWLSEFGTDDKTFYETHKEWFLHDEQGNAKLGSWFGHYILDFSNPEVKEYLHKIYSMMTDDWGYEYFKLDGENATRDIWGENRVRAYNPALDANTAFREGLAVIRQALGSSPGAFLSACGPEYPTESIGVAQSARLGGDILNFSPSVPSHKHSETPSFRSVRTALEGMRRGYYTHNIAWYADPDGVLLRPPLTEEEVHTWFSVVGLTGQLLMLGDDMPALSAERRDIARKVMPVADIKPMDLYPQSSTPHIWILHIQRGFGTWAVVGLFNWDYDANEVPYAFASSDQGSPLRAVFNHDAALLGTDRSGPTFWALAENAQAAIEENRHLESLPNKPAGLELLPVPAYLVPPPHRRVVLNFERVGFCSHREYLLFDFWKQQFLGKIKGEHTAVLAPHECQVLSVRMASGNPQLIGADRHITMGGVELKDEDWQATKRQLRLSVQLVQHYPTTLTIYKAGKRFINASAGDGDINAVENVDTVRLTIVRTTSQVVDIVVQFA